VWKTAIMGENGDLGESVSCLFFCKLLILKISGGERGNLRHRDRKKPERADSVMPQSRHIRLLRAIHGDPSFGRVGFDLIVLTGWRAVGLVACHWWAGQAETVGEVRHETRSMSSRRH
jgi:hypothetical protein